LGYIGEMRNLLFVSDAISASTGLGRITGDLAVRVHEHLGDVYRVATAGYGGNGSVKYPFPQYHFHSVSNWLLPELPAIAADFAGDEELSVMFVWDASRLYWVGMPQMCPDPALRRWVENAKIKKWLYGAIDAEGPFGRLPQRIAETYKGFDRVLDYSAFSSGITGNPDYLRHGIDTTVFKPHPRAEARQRLIGNGFAGLTPGSLLIGIIATNQARKNWPLAMETARILLDRGHDVRVWAHTDVISRHWDIGQLIVDWGLLERVGVTTSRFTDEQMAWTYSACDVTLSNAPEGFGFSPAESLACGVPTIAGSYGAQAEFVPKAMQIDPIAYSYEGAFCSKRPVHSAAAWASKVEKILKNNYAHSILPPHVDWDGPSLWGSWEKWFREGL
jgi:glycosyltransferase involved in cell wall biosynthesis